MTKLSIKQVRDVAHLARLTLREQDIMKYQKELGQILTEIDKINQAEVKEDEEMLICPTTNENFYNSDEVKDMVTKEDVFSNSKNSNGMYIVVPKVVNE